LYLPDQSLMEHESIALEPRVMMGKGKLFNLAVFKSNQNCSWQSACLVCRKTIVLSLYQIVQRH